MLNASSEKLTEREREYVKHFREAQARGVSFAGYCRSAGLKASEWHTVRHGMVRKGLLPAGGGRRARKKPSRQKRSRFIPVRLQASGREDIAGAACRLRHASGWVIECAGFPEVQWLKGLIEGAQP
jgi:hypothetical protein